MFSKQIKTFSILLIFIFLTGCYPTGEIQQVNESEAIEKISEIEAKNEHIEIDTSITDSAPSELPKLNVYVMKWDDDAVNDMFIDPYTNLVHEEYPSDYFSDGVYDLYNLYDDNGECTYRLVIEPGRISASKRQKSSRYGYATISYASRVYCFADYFDDDEISDFSKSAAAKMVKAELEALGLTNLSEPIVYSVTAEKANNYLISKGYGEEYAEWTSDDEIYVVQYLLEYNGIPLTSAVSGDRAFGGHGAYYVGAYIGAIVTKDEVLALDCSNIISPSYTYGESVSINCDAQNAMKTAAEYYNGMTLDDSDIELFNPKLVYVPYEQIDEERFTLVPMWRIDASIKDDDDLVGTNYYLFIDAEKGNIIVW